MLKKILIGIAVLVIGIIAAALLKSPDYRVERSLVIDAPAEEIFPYFNRGDFDRPFITVQRTALKRSRTAFPAPAKATPSLSL